MFRKELALVAIMLAIGVCDLQAVETGSISGTISYSGTQTGTIDVGAFTDPNFSGEPDYFVEDISLGDYTLSNLPDGTYYIASVMVTDEEIKKTDPWGVYGTLENPIPVTITGAGSEPGIDITLVDGTEESPNPFYYFVDAWSQNWSYGEQYIVHFSVEDPNHEATSVEITGPGIADSLSIDYDNNGNEWNSWHTGKSLDFGSSPPTPPLTYTFTIVDPSMTTVKTDTVESFVSVYATDLSPSGGETVSGPLVFSWTGVGAGYTYSVELNDSSGRIWNAYELTTTSVIYDGPALTPGAEYYYWVVVDDEYGNSSFAEANFVYQAAGTGSISGTVKDYLGNPVNNAQIEVARSMYPDEPTQCIEVVSIVFSGADGTYSANDLPEGTYRLLRCTPPTGTGLAIQWAEDINVTAEEVTTVNFTLPLGGTISGKVTNTEESPLSEIVMQMNAPEGHYRFCGTGTQTDVSGGYTLSNIPEGTWELKAWPREELGSPYVSKKVTGISVTASQTTTVNITLSRGGWISGQVVDYTDSPVANAEIDIWSEEGDEGDGWTETDEDGNYTTQALSPGVYYLMVEPPEERTDLAIAYLEDIHVVESATTAVDVTLVEAGTIEGSITNYDTLPPLAEGTVGYFVVALPGDLVFPPIDNLEVIGDQPMCDVESDGTYEMTQLAPGTYDLFLYCGKPSEDEGEELFEHMTVVGSVLNVSVTSGEVISGQNITAAIGAASLAGTITSSDGGDIYINEVRAVFLSGADGKFSACAGFVKTDSRVDQGSYRIDNLPAGTCNLFVYVKGYQAIEEAIEIGDTAITRDFTLYPVEECPNLDGINPVVNFIDFSILAYDWEQTGLELEGDLNGDETVDTKDLAILALYWLSDCSEP